jgi:hypothetical protein
MTTGFENLIIADSVPVRRGFFMSSSYDNTTLWLWTLGLGLLDFGVQRFGMLFQLFDFTQKII